MLKHPEGTNPDGSVKFRFELTPEEVADGYVMFVSGPIAGTFNIEGTAYDVSEYAQAVKAEHVGALHIAIHKAHHAAGRFLDLPVPTLAEASVPSSPASLPALPVAPPELPPTQ